MRDLDAIADRMAMLVSTLGERLSPVLRSEDETFPAESPSAIVAVRLTSELTERMGRIARQLEVEAERISALMNRLDI